MKQQKDKDKVICTVHALLSDLNSCSLKRDLQRGRKIHVKAVQSKNDSNLNVVIALIKMYSKCGSMVDARRIFDLLQKPDVVCWNVLLLGYAENGQGLIALELYSRMKAQSCVTDSVTYLAAIKSCITLAKKGVDCQEQGRKIHSEIGCHLNLYVQNTLSDMYAKMGSMEDARRVFDSISRPDVVSWNILLLGYAENGEGLTALGLFLRMKDVGCKPNSITYVAALKACINVALTAPERKGDCLQWGRDIHSEIHRHSNQYVQNMLVDMYVKCGSMVEARRVFDSICKPDVVSWTAMLLGYAENEQGLAALDLFSVMKASGVRPDPLAYVAALKACISLVTSCGREYSLERGRMVHSEVGSNLDIYVQCTLIDMYSKCRSMVDARCVFDSISRPDVASWNVLLTAHAENGEGYTGLEMFSRMKASAVVPDAVTYVAVLKSCILVGALSLGRKFHTEISEYTSRVVTCLVDFYAKCGSIVEAREVFELHTKARDVTTWNAMLAGYGSFDTASAFELFEAMQDQGFHPDAVTFVCMMLCSSHAGAVEKAREYIVAMPIRYGVVPTTIHFNSMVDVLGRANQLHEAIAVLQNMPCNPDPVTWTAILGACCKWKNVEIGRLAFQSLVEVEHDSNAYVLMAQIHGMWEEQKRQMKPLKSSLNLV